MSRLLFVSLFIIFRFSSVLSQDPSVIIVGAGPSGIAAALKLLENSITNIIILEAENRIGGRVNSTTFGDGYIDIGAEYCHGEIGNTVYQTVKDLGLLAHSNVVNPETNKIFYSNGSQIPRDLALELDNLITDYTGVIERRDGLNLGEAFSTYYNKTILTKYNSDSEKLKIVTDAIKFSHDVILMHEGSFRWDTPASGRHYTACEGDQMMTWKTGGYQSFLNVLLKRYLDQTQSIPIEDYTYLNTKVEKIIWNGDKVKVQTSINRNFEADHLIFTPSVGVLQADRDTLFEPALPQRKIEAIDAMGFDAIIKIILHFPNKWWGTDDKLWYFLWNSEDLDTVANEFNEGPTNKDGLPWVTSIVGMVIYPSNPSVLTVWFSGELIPQVEQTSEEIIKKGVLFVANKFLGNDYNITEPDEVIWSKWYTNSNFRGTWSYVKADYFKQDVSYQEILAEPLKNEAGNALVLFAGEATNPTLYSTIHGAVDAGRREAERIIELHNSGSMVAASLYKVMILFFVWKYFHI